MKRPRLDDASRKRLVKILLVVAGLFSLFMFLVTLRDAALSWEEDIWLERLMNSTWVMFFLAGSTMLLLPLARIKAVRLIVGFALWVIETIVIFWHSYLFVAAPCFVLVIVPTLAWVIPYALGWIPVGAEQGFMYVLLVAWSVVFTYWGRSMTRLYIGKYLREDYSRLFALLHPRLVRVYIYAIMAVTYVLANVEKFSNITLPPLPFWTTYKEVLVEVLLTYVAIDSVLDEWRESKEKNSR